MSKEKYNERVRQRAGELAKNHFSSQVKKYNVTSIKKRKEWDQLHASHRDMLAREFIGVARLSVQREAEAYRRGFYKRDSLSAFDLETELQSLGLMPENDKPCGT